MAFIQAEKGEDARRAGGAATIYTGSALFRWLDTQLIESFTRQWRCQI
jgi:hypothetical protein